MVYQKNIEFNKKELPLFIREIGKKTDRVFIFLNGINADPYFIDLLNNEVFNNSMIITFDNIAHKTNNEKSTRSFKKYLTYTLELIKFIKNLDICLNKKIIVFGESFGATLCINLWKKEPNLANLFFCWNPPTKIAKNDDMPHKVSTSIKSIITFLLNIETWTWGFFDPRLTSNKAVVRINKIKPKKKVSTKLNILVWRNIHKTKEIIKSGLSKNIFLVQSMQDILCNKQFFNNLVNKNNITILPTGYHLLSVETNESKILFSILNNKIKELKC